MVVVVPGYNNMRKKLQGEFCLQGYDSFFFKWFLINIRVFYISYSVQKVIFQILLDHEF